MDYVTLLQALSGMVVGVSVSFVLGTVAGEPYHAVLLDLDRKPDKRQEYWSLLVVWYFGAAVLSLPVSLCWLTQDRRVRYPWLVAGLTVLFWFLWCVHAYNKLGVSGLEPRVRRILFFLSTFALAVLSGLGAAGILNLLW